METIKIAAASKSFNGHKVLNHLDVSFSAGKIYGIVGYNGSGKTVLLKCICGFLTLDEGEITILGKTLKKDIDMIQDAGVIIEEPAFLKEYSGKKNLEFLYSIRNKPDSNLTAQVLQKVGLDAKSRKKVKHYSLGMKQRLAIAQAIMEDPQILLLDEPMNGLDRKGVAEIRELLLDLKECGKTIILVSHNQEDIQVLCDEIYEIDEGSLVPLKKTIFLSTNGF